MLVPFNEAMTFIKGGIMVLTGISMLITDVEKCWHENVVMKNRAGFLFCQKCLSQPILPY